MWFVESTQEIDAIEGEYRALVAVFLHHCYDETMISGVLSARRGFDQHVNSAWHLLIPCYSRGLTPRAGYSVDMAPGPDNYSAALAYSIAKNLNLCAVSLPCIVFRARSDEHYFLKLNGKSNEEVLQILREIGDLANECHVNGPQDAETYRRYVNTVVINHLRQKKLLSALAWLCCTNRVTGEPPRSPDRPILQPL